MLKIKNKKAMTLLEVVVVISIIGILSSISIVSFSQYKRSTALESAAEEVLAALRETQNYSLSGKSIEPNCANYRFVPTPLSPNYRITNISGTACSINNQFSLKNGAIFNAGSSSIVFRLPHGSIGGTGNRSVTISNGTGNNYTICVNGAGLITKKLNDSTCP